MDFDWERIKKSLKDGATMSMEKIEEYTKIGKLKIEEMAAKRKIERNFSDIGERVYDLIKEGNGRGVAEDLAVKKNVENIDSLKTELVSIGEKIKEVAEEAKRGRRKSSNEEEEVAGV
jgi:uncharacterized protein YoaH (UPF0181 family)